MNEMSLFDEPLEPVDPRTVPLAERMRPRSLDEVIGQDDVIGPGRPLREMIERDLLHPSVSTLKRIAQALGIAAGKLMFPSGKAPGRAMVSLQRKGARKRILFPHSNIEYELLTPDLRRRVSMLWVSAQPGAESGPAFTHELPVTVPW